MPAWNETDDRKLLLACIKLSNQTPNWDEVGALIGRTGESIRQRYMKLKKEAGEFTATANDDGSAAPPTVATPTPRKRKSKAKSKKAASDEEDDDDEGTPLIKKTKKSQKVIKAEEEEEAEA
ncbi:hypothetical protein KCU99_g2381, partial [Aureobasidium melanogenum]